MAQVQACIPLRALFPVFVVMIFATIPWSCCAHRFVNGFFSLGFGGAAGGRREGRKGTNSALNTRKIRQLLHLASLTIFFFT